jgi:uncharacterized protein (TIGR03066 family)
MRSILGNFVVAALLGAISLTIAEGGDAKTATNAQKIVGLWKVIEGDAPPGATVEFTSAGKMIMKADANGKKLVMNGTYEVVNDKITSKMTFGGKTKQETSIIQKLDDKSLTVQDEKGKVEKYERISKKKTK